MSDYASWELPDWRKIYEDRDADGDEVLAVYACSEARCYLYRDRGGDILHSDGFVKLIKKQPPRMYACQQPTGCVLFWRSSRIDVENVFRKNPGARIIYRPADADPMDFTQWRVEE